MQVQVATSFKSGVVAQTRGAGMACKLSLDRTLSATVMTASEKISGFLEVKLNVRRYRGSWLIDKLL